MEVAIPNITGWQILEGLIAVPAFAPATVCTGYLVAWTPNFHDFRRRTLVERIFWSVPLSIACSTIAAVLLGKVISLEAVVIVFLVCAVGVIATLAYEGLQLRAGGKKWPIGWRPFGTRALIVAVIWSVVAILLLVDFQKGENLYASLTIFDHGMRVSWVESVMRTGVPPMNPLYMDQHPAPMRYYYFWYVLCAAIAKMWHLSARAVMMASCVWAGFSVVALAGLYIKHFLEAGERTRRQVLRVCGLLTVTGLGVLVNLWSIVHHTRQLPGDLEIWRAGQITSWVNSMLWVPHHVASMVCCMIGFLAVWLAWQNQKQRVMAVGLTAAACASAFGLSVYVAFAFFIVALVWALWMAILEKSLEPGILLSAAGILAAVLLLPYLHELTHGSSGMQGGSSVFSFAIRETIPPEGLLGTSFFRQIAVMNPFWARNLANLTLLTLGYAVELGFYLAVLLIYLFPLCRGRQPLTAAQRSLVGISSVTLLLISVVRSNVLEVNDFGWRAAFLLQFPLLLLGSELLSTWRLADLKNLAPAEGVNLPGPTPHLLRVIASVALIFGVLTSFYQALMVRFTLPLYDLHGHATHDPRAGKLVHKAYISSIGYAQLSQAIPKGAIVQYNPWSPDLFWIDSDWLGVAHQSVIDLDLGVCGAEFGGNPKACPAMAAALDHLYKDSTADQARATCRLYGIQYLVTSVYDPVWSDQHSWVWTLKPVVSDEEFRAVDCR